MTEEESHAFEYADRLIEIARTVVEESKIVLDAIPDHSAVHWAREPKIVAVAVLCRSISNFNAALSLAHLGQVIEARMIVRPMFENMLYLAALRERGATFVEKMIADDAFNKAALAQLTLKLTGKHGANPDNAGSLRLRSIINELRKKSARKLRVDEIAASGVVELAYIEYARLSLDSVHCSVMTLGRHIFEEHDDKMVNRVISIQGRSPPTEVFSTILHGCRALMGVTVGANELLGGTTAGPLINLIVMEFERRGWVAVD
jgi:hypothetical protein